MGILNKRNNLTEIQSKKLDYIVNIKPQIEGIFSGFSDENNNDLLQNNDIKLNHKIYTLEKSKNRSLENALFEKDSIKQSFLDETNKSILSLEKLRTNIIKIYNSDNEENNFTYTNVYLNDLKNNNTSKFDFKNLSLTLEDNISLFLEVLNTLEEEEDSVLNRLRMSKELDSTTNFAQSLVNLKTFKENSIYPNSYLRQYFSNDEVSSRVFSNNIVNGAVQTNLYEHERSNNNFYDNNNFVLTDDYANIVSINRNQKLKLNFRGLEELNDLFNYENINDSKTITKIVQFQPLNDNSRIINNNISSKRLSSGVTRETALNNDSFRRDREYLTFPNFWSGRNHFKYNLNIANQVNEINLNTFNNVLIPENITTDNTFLNLLVSIKSDFARKSNLFSQNFLTANGPLLFNDVRNRFEGSIVINRLKELDEESTLFKTTINQYKTENENNNNNVKISRHNVLDNRDFNDDDIFCNRFITTNYDFINVNKIFNTLKNKKSFFAGKVLQQRFNSLADVQSLERNIISFYRMYKDNPGGRNGNHYLTNFLGYTFNGLLGNSLASEINDNNLFNLKKNEISRRLGEILETGSISFNKINSPVNDFENENKIIYSSTKKINNITSKISNKHNLLKNNVFREDDLYKPLSGNNSIINENFDSNYLLGKLNGEDINLLDYLNSNAQYTSIKDLNISLSSQEALTNIKSSYENLSNNLKQNISIKNSKFKNGTFIYKKVLEKINRYINSETLSESRAELLYNYGIAETLKENSIDEISKDILFSIISKNFNTNNSIIEYLEEPEVKNNFLGKDIDFLKRFMFSENAANGLVCNNRIVYDFLNSKTYSVKEFISILSAIKNNKAENIDFEDNSDFVIENFKNSLGLLMSTNISVDSSIENTQIFNFFYNSYDTIEKLNRNIRIDENQTGFEGHFTNSGVNGIFDRNSRGTYPLVDIVKRTHPNLSFNTKVKLNGRNFIYNQNVINPEVVFPNNLDERNNFNISCNFNNVEQQCNYSIIFNDQVKNLYTEQISSNEENKGIINIISNIAKEIILEEFNLEDVNLNNIATKIENQNVEVINDIFDIVKNITFVTLVTYKNIFEEISYAESLKAFLIDMSVKNNITNSGKTFTSYANDYFVKSYMLNFRLDSENSQEIIDFTDARNKITNGRLRNLFSKQRLDSQRINNILENNLSGENRANLNDLTQNNIGLSLPAKFAVVINSLSTEDFSLNNIYKNSFKFLCSPEEYLTSTQFSSQKDLILKNTYKCLLLSDIMKSISEDFILDYINLDEDFFNEFFFQIFNEELIENNDFVKNFIDENFSLDTSILQKNKISEMVLFISKQIEFLKNNKKYLEEYSTTKSNDKIGTKNYKTTLEENENIILSRFPSNIENNPHMHSLVYNRGNYPSHNKPGRRNISIYSYDNTSKFNASIYPIEKTIISVDHSFGDIEYQDFNDKKFKSLSTQNFYINTEIVDDNILLLSLDDNFNNKFNRQTSFRNENLNNEFLRNIYINGENSIRYNKNDVSLNVPFSADAIDINTNDDITNKLKIIFKNNVLSEDSTILNILNYKNNFDEDDIKTSKYLSIEDNIKDKINKVYLKYKFGIDLNPMSNSRIISKNIINIIQENNIAQELFDLELSEIVKFHEDISSSIVRYTEGDDIKINHINQFLSHLTSSLTFSNMFNLLEENKKYFTVCSDPSQSLVYYNKNIIDDSGSLFQNEIEVQRFGNFKSKFNRQIVLNKVEVSRNINNKYMLISNENLIYKLRETYEYPSDYFYFVYTGENNEKLVETNNIVNIRGQNV